MSQREFFRINEGRGIVQGVFYVHGNRVWRKLCTIDELEFGKSGRRRSERQKDNLMGALYADKERDLEVDGPIKRRGIRLKEALQSWIELNQGIKSPRTIREHYAHAGNLFVEAVGNIRLTDVSIHDLDRFIILLQDRGLAPVSINVRLRALKTFLRWAQERNYLSTVPKITLLPTTKKLPMVLKDDQIVRLFAHIQRKA